MPRAERQTPPDASDWVLPLVHQPFPRLSLFANRGPLHSTMEPDGVYGRGTWLSLRAARRLADRSSLRVRVLDLRWLAPLPTSEVIEQARPSGRLLVVDDCRLSGGTAESLGAALLETRQPIEFARISSADCYVPIGRAATTVLVNEDEIEQAALQLCGRRL